MNAITIQTNQNFTATASPLAGANPGAINIGSVTWASSAPLIAQPSVQPGNLSAIVTSAAVPGTAVITVNFQAPGSSIVQNSTFTVTVNPAPADHLDFAFTTPQNN